MDNGIAVTKTVEWKEHKDFLAAGVRDLFLNEYDMDSNVTFNGDSLKVHRIILAIFLPTFKRSLDVVSSNGGNLRELNLNFVADRTEDVRALVQFVYTGKMTVVDSRLDHMRRLARELSFDGLAKALDQPSGATTSDTRGKRRSSARSKLKLEPQEEQAPADDEEMDEESQDQDEMEDDHDSDYRPSTHDEGRRANGHRAKRSKGKTSCRNRPTTAAKGAAEAKSTKVDQVELDRYCEHVFQSLQQGDVELQEPTSPSDVNMKPARIQRGWSNNKERATDKRQIGALVKCAKCGKEFLNKIALRQHLKQCGSSQQFPCRFCEHEAATRLILRQHMLDVHIIELAAEKRNRVNHITCPVPMCKYACVNPRRLRQHTQRMHSGDRQFKCHECKYAAVRQSELDIHVTACHLKLKNFQCDHCVSRFATKSGLNYHVRNKHQGRKDYKCEHCAKEFVRHTCLSAHLLAKHNIGDGLELQVCDVCGKTFTRRGGLLEHTRRVHKTSLETLLKVYAPRHKDSQDGTGQVVVDVAGHVETLTEQASNHNAAAEAAVAVPYHDLLAAIGCPPSDMPGSI